MSRADWAHSPAGGVQFTRGTNLGGVSTVPHADDVLPADVETINLPEVSERLGVPVTIDATHAVQLPGADPRTGGSSTGGRRDGVSVIAKAAVAAK